MQAHVGIFWLIGSKLIVFSEVADNVKSANGVADSDYAHDAVWVKVQREHPQLRDKEYWQIPRGRVIHDVKRDRFIIYCPAKEVEDAGLIARIRNKFSLPPHRTDVIPDLHYDPPTDDLFTDDD